MDVICLTFLARDTRIRSVRSARLPVLGGPQTRRRDLDLAQPEGVAQLGQGGLCEVNEAIYSLLRSCSRTLSRGARGDEHGDLGLLRGYAGVDLAPLLTGLNQTISPQNHRSSRNKRIHPTRQRKPIGSAQFPNRRKPSVVICYNCFRA